MRIGFVSRENAVRSLMAEAVARKMLSDLGLKAEIFSAGVEPAKSVHPLTLEVLKEKGYSTRGLYPKPLSKIPYRKLDVLITIGNEAKDACEFVIGHKRRENWQIEEPKENRQAFLETLEEIEEHMAELLKLSPKRS